MSTAEPIPAPDLVNSTDTVRVAVHDLGGKGPTLLLAHATGFCGRVWEPVVETIGSRFHCVALDFRAHGHSTRPDRPLVWDGMADDVLAVVDRLAPTGPLAAVGHSMGGSALALAEAKRPGTFRCVWAFEPILFERTDDNAGPEPSPISAGARKRRATFATRREAYDRYRSRPPLAGLDDRALRAYVDHGFADTADGRVTLRCRPDDEAGVFEHHNTDAPAALAGITIPYRLAASGDEQAPAEACRAIAARHPHLELVTYEDLTHFGPLEDPDRIAADVLAWLA
ncbi:MAG: alpha/beta hydrolase [Actinomycetota bacterium]